MTVTATSIARHTAARRRGVRGGFTFIEVMFAVLTLSAGVIMIATLLPAALRTAQETRENALGLATLEGGYHTFRATLPEDAGEIPVSVDAGMLGRVMTWPAADEAALPNDVINLWWRTLGNRVSSADPEQMWIPFFYRPSVSAAAQVAMVSTRSRAEISYPAGPSSPGYNAFFEVDLSGGAPVAGPLVLEDNHPLPISVATLGGAGVLVAGEPAIQTQTDIVRIFPRLQPDGTPGTGSLGVEQIAEAAVEGAAIVLVDNLGRLRVYRLGERIGYNGPSAPGPDFITYSLQPGSLDTSKFFNGGNDANPDNDGFLDATASTRRLHAR